MFDNISLSISRLYTFAFRLNLFRRTITLNTSSDLAAIPAFQHSAQFFPPQHHQHSPTQTQPWRLLFFLHSAGRNITVTHVLKSIKELIQEKIEIMQLGAWIVKQILFEQQLWKTLLVWLELNVLEIVNCVRSMIQHEVWSFIQLYKELQRG